MEKLALLGGPMAASDLNTPAWPPLSDATAQELVEVYNSRNWSFGGPHEKQFAADFAASHDAKFGIFMANGTVTLQCALAVHGIGVGDEVIVPALTWPATAMAPIYLGAKPVFADIEASTLCLDPQAFEAAITEKTKAVIPVHLYGGMADIDAIKTIAAKHDIVVIEDCAHAQGGKWNDKGLGSHGAVGSFSFQQSKTMAAGEGGICLTNDEVLAEKLYRSKHIGYGDGSKQGAGTAPPPDLPVYNFRATEFQAVILQHQLRELDTLIALYNRNATILENRLREVPGARVQSRGRCATRQSFYAWSVVFDEEPMAGVPFNSITEALQAEGVSMSGTYGVVYKHVLFNLAPEKYRIENGQCEVAENIGQGRTAMMLHHHLGADDASIAAIGEAIAKVAGSADALRERASQSTPEAHSSAPE